MTTEKMMKHTLYMCGQTPLSYWVNDHTRHRWLFSCMPMQAGVTSYGYVWAAAAKQRNLTLSAELQQAMKTVGNAAELTFGDLRNIASDIVDC